MQNLNNLKIGHYADIQVKVRETNLYQSHEDSLVSIETITMKEELDILVLAGDLFEYAEPNDAERKLIYNHIARLLKIKSLKELVIMVGNHDIVKEKKKLDSLGDSNAVDTFMAFLDKIDDEYSQKVTYLKEQKQYISKVNSNLGWIAYSLEDGTSAGSNIKKEELDLSIMNICVYHDILREYVDDSKLPVKKQTYDKLASIETSFYSNIIFAGDIHEKYIRKSVDESKIFFYPGSTIQRNFGEGTYLKIRKNIDLKHADSKYIIIHNIDVSERTHNYDYHSLPSYLNYITIDLNSTLVYEGFIEKLRNSLENCVFGVNQTFIKIIVSNAFIKFDKEIFMTVTDVTKTKSGLTTIDINYDKIISKNTATNSILGSSLNELDNQENVDNFENEITSENINKNFDNILLDKAKLIKLFDSQLDLNRNDLIKEFGDESVIEDIFENIKSIFLEQLDFSMNSVPNYKVKLLYAQTNGFMQLGAIKVNLDIPGLTRITGTNGVGKTQLYNMIRWIIDDLVIEGLKSNQKINNTMLIFNDELINKDNVIGKLGTEINGVHVEISRYAVRKWKPKATDDDKRGMNIRKFIDSVNTGLEIKIHSKNNGIITKSGDEAETLLKQWFGNTVNNIMILNQYKILGMLNMSSTNLRELVMDYIGNDYLEALDNNLETVKAGLSTKRPTRNKVDIRILIDKSLSEQLTIQKYFETYEETKNDLESKITTQKDDLKVLKDELLNLGNIPEKIKGLDQNITDTNKNISEFQEKTKQDIPIFEKIKPTKPETDEKQKTIDTNKAEIENKKQSIVTLYDDVITDSKNKWFDENTTKIEKLNNHLKSDFDKIVAENTQLVTDYNVEVARLKQELLDVYNADLKVHNASYDEKLLEKQKLKTDNETLQLKIDENTKSIESGVCSECGKPHDEDANEFEKLKANKELENVGYQETIDKNKIKDSSLLKELQDLTVLKSRFGKYVDEINKGNIAYFDTDEYINNIVIDKESVTYKNIVSWSDYNGKINACNILIDNAKSNNVEHFNIKLHLDIKKKVAELTKINTAINNNSYVVVCEQLEVTHDYLTSIQKLINDKKIFEDSLVLFEKANDVLIKDLKVITDEYLVNIESYNEEQSTHNENVNKIITENSGVDEHNKLLDSYKNSLLHYEKDLKILKNDLPKYEEKSSKELVDLETLRVTELELTELNNDNKQKIIDRTNVENTLKDLNKEYDDYLKYQKDTAIFNIYSKIIKKDFKDCVFGYYREFLNITFNLLLTDLNFKLQWHENGELYFYQVKKGQELYRPVQLVSGMQSCFLGLSLIYAIHVLNVKNDISHIFIDEISGQLNSGKELVKTEEEVVDYQEKLLLLLSKFNNKNIFIVDHVIKQMWETVKYQVNFGDEGSTYTIVE